MAGIVTNPGTQSAAMGNQSQASQAQNQQYQLMQGLISKYLGNAMNPSTTASGVANATQPLSAGAIAGIQNSTAGNIAERGLSTSFPQWQAALGQNMGSAEMNQQNTGMSNYFSGQKLPFMVPHPGVSMPSVPQQPSLLGNFLGSGLGAAGGTAAMMALG